MDVLFTEPRMPSGKVLNSLDPGLRQDDVLCLIDVFLDSN